MSKYIGNIFIIQMFNVAYSSEMFSQKYFVSLPFIALFLQYSSL